MGLKEILAANVDLSKVDTGVVGMAQFGILGNKILNDAKKLQEEKKTEAKPGKYCEKLCPVNETCSTCVASQEKFLQLVMEVEQIEMAIANPQIPKAKKITKCSLCGAPYEQGAKLCPYCDTAYPVESGINTDIPESKIEQDNLLKQKAMEAYNEYSKFLALSSENRQSTWKGKMPGIIQGAVNGLNNMANNMLKLSPEQLVYGAKKHNVTLSVYLYGLADGTYKSLAEERLAEESARQKQYSQQNMQIERERQEKLRKINYEKNQAMGNMVYGKTTNWASANSTKQECWNCSYYYRANSTCTRTNASANSSGSCIYWK